MDHHAVRHHVLDDRSIEMKVRERKTDRNKEIYALRQAGVYYHLIAEQYGISVTRVRQIIEVEEAKEGAKKLTKQIENHDIRNLSDSCKKCPDNRQPICHCFDECIYPIEILYEFEDKRYQEAKNGDA